MTERQKTKDRRQKRERQKTKDKMTERHEDRKTERQNTKYRKRKDRKRKKQSLFVTFVLVQTFCGVKYGPAAGGSSVSSN